MRTKFPGYFKLSNEEIRSLWEEAVFTFDANILLNLYRYSDETRDELFKILEKIKTRVWIPHQSAQEFFDNRLNVINQQEKAYDEAIASLHSIETEFKNSRQHPFIATKLLNEFSDLSKHICEQLKTSKDFHNRRITEDDILSNIEALFEDKVGEEYDSQTLENLFKEGESRFRNKIPPGFKDSGKKDDGDKDIRKYGDFIVWKQTMDKSKDSERAIILVTDDRKEDWWVRFKGKTVSPRPELIKEFKDYTSQSFHMYQSDRFLEYAREFLDESINEKAIEEIRELRRLDERKRLSKMRKDKELLKYREFGESLFKQRLLLEEELNFIKEKKNRIKSKLSEQYLILENDPSQIDEFQLNKYRQELQSYEEKMQNIKHHLNELKEREYIFRKNYTH